MYEEWMKNKDKLWNQTVTKWFCFDNRLFCDEFVDYRAAELIDTSRVLQVLCHRQVFLFFFLFLLVGDR